MPVYEAAARGCKAEVHLACTRKLIRFVFDLGVFIALFAVYSRLHFFWLVAQVVGGWWWDEDLLLSDSQLIKPGSPSQLWNVQMFFAVRLEKNNTVHACNIYAVKKRGFPSLHAFHGHIYDPMSWSLLSTPSIPAP